VCPNPSPISWGLGRAYSGAMVALGTVWRARTSAEEPTRAGCREICAGARQQPAGSMPVALTFNARPGPSRRCFSSSRWSTCRCLPGHHARFPYSATSLQKHAGATLVSFAVGTALNLAQASQLCPGVEQVIIVARMLPAVATPPFARRAQFRGAALSRRHGPECSRAMQPSASSSFARVISRAICRLGLSSLGTTLCPWWASHRSWRACAPVSRVPLQQFPTSTTRTSALACSSVLRSLAGPRRIPSDFTMLTRRLDCEEFQHHRSESVQAYQLFRKALLRSP